MAHTNVHMLMGNLTTGENTPTIFIDRVNGRVGIGTDASPHTDGSTYAIDVGGSLYATELHGDGSNLTGITDSKWVESITNPDDIYYTTGNVGIGGDPGTVPLKVHGNVESTGDFVGGILRSDRTIGRTSHSNGYFVGSYNVIPGGNSNKTNPIYTIGSSYMPSDDSLGDMYGIGYTHNNFTSILTGGWGMYVAADGDARIGLNGSNGHIKNTGHIYCGGTVHLSGSGSQGIRSATGNYGTVQTTGEGNGGWEGFSIDGRYVFMSADNGSCGIYNDIDNEWMIYCYRNSTVQLYDNGQMKFQVGNPNEFYTTGLRIFGTEASYNPYGPDHDFWTNGGQIQGDTSYQYFGLYVSNWVRAPGYIAFSDRRIKKDFVELDDTLALNTLRKLKPTTYRYLDKRRNTKDRVIGFIAQEVAEVLPDAVSLQDNVIPNIQCEASVKKVGEKEFELTLKEPHVVTVGAKLELRLPHIDRMIVVVKSVINDTTFTITQDENFPFKDDVDRIWVCGEEIDDFHHLDKNAIFTVATAALQEVDRRQVAHDERIAALEARNLELGAALQNALNRIEALEAARA